ncbi:VanZ family protein [Psychromonas hadalis]|uniref:VanZ family protein n=1 Tax=Psychromonas hadalis TaxID=211669 RepID=UPI0003B3D1E6|nr:VanZ family protein [Psychromonas hadalis]
MLKKIALTAISCLLITLLFIDVPDVIPLRLMLTLWSIGHIVVFSFLGGLLLIFYPKLKHASLFYQFTFLTISSLIAGISIELIQPFFSRTAQLEDIFFNYIGTLAILIYRGNFSHFKKWKLTLQALCTALLFYLMHPTFLTAYDEYRLIRDFPILTNYYNETTLTRWKTDGTLTLLKQNKKNKNMMQATFISQPASRVVLRYFNGNWQPDAQGYQQLVLRFFNPHEKTLPLRIIITDKHYDKSHSGSKYRFAITVQLSRGWSTHHIKLTDIEQKPQARNIDLTQIAGIDFYMYKLKTAVTLYIDEIKLIK